MQVHRALKHAVNTGLLRHRSGRYKILSTVNPAATPAPTAKEPAKNDRKTEEKQSKPDVRATPVGGAKTPRRESRGRKYIYTFLRVTVIRPCLTSALSLRNDRRRVRIEIYLRSKNSRACTRVSLSEKFSFHATCKLNSRHGELRKRATPKRRRRSSGRRSDNARKKSRRRSPHAKRPRATVQSRKVRRIRDLSRRLFERLRVSIIISALFGSNI